MSNKNDDSKYQVASTDEYGIKTTKGGAQYMLNTFIVNNEEQIDVRQEYNKLIKKCQALAKQQGEDKMYTCTSIMYKNDDKWERNPFGDNAIGFVISDNYKYHQMFYRNMGTKEKSLHLDEHGRVIKHKDHHRHMRHEGEQDYCYNKNNKSNQDLEEEFIEAAKERDKERKVFFINRQNDINNEYKDFLKQPNTYEGKLFQHDNDSKPYLNCTNNNGKFDFRNDDLTFSNYSHNKNDLDFSKTMYHFDNNEQLVETKAPKISSLIINLPICNTKNPYLNNRFQKLKQIAYSMESIIKFQRDVLKKDKILFRDEEKQKMELLTLEQFKDRIIDLCEKHNRQCKKEEEKIDMDKVKFPDEQIQQSNIENKIQEKNNANITTGHDMNIIKECFHEPNHIPPKKHGRWCRFKKWFKNLFSFNYHDKNNAHASYDTNVIKNDINTMIYSNM